MELLNGSAHTQTEVWFAPMSNSGGTEVAGAQRWRPTPLAPAALTKHHTWGGFNGNLCSHISGGWKPEIRASEVSEPSASGPGFYLYSCGKGQYIFSSGF